MVRLVNALLRFHNLHSEPERLSDAAWARAFADLRWIAEIQKLNLPPIIREFKPY